jgi:hypothetical protein
MHLADKGMPRDKVVTNELSIFQPIKDNQQHPIWRVLQNTYENSKDGFLTPVTNVRPSPQRLEIVAHLHQHGVVRAGVA